MQNNIANILKQKRQDLTNHLITDSQAVYLEKHAQIIDDYFHESFEKSIIGPSLDVVKNPYAIVAIGGYGRQEQCIHSDIDLLFLFKNNIPNKVEELIKEIVYPLWDMGLSVGHATRTQKECIKLSEIDIEVLTSFLDARFICGISLIFTELMEQIREKIIFKQSNKIIDWLVEKNRERQARFGDSSYLLEPNLKEGHGGLRDYHTMLWIAKIKSGLTQPRDLEFMGYLSNLDYEILSKSLAFIWRIRNILHNLTDRKNDQLYMEYQIKIADFLKYEQRQGHAPVEVFLGELHSHIEFIKEQHQIFMYELGYQKKKRTKSLYENKNIIKGLIIEKDILQFLSPEDILKSPLLLIKIFEESDSLKIPLSAESIRLIKEFSYLVDEDFRSDPFAIRSFEKILLSQLIDDDFDTLNEMLQTGFLLQFIPEFKGIVNRIQYNEYHLYPVDKHSINTVKKIKKFGLFKNDSNDKIYFTLFKEIKNRKLLFWAALLHDIGKGEFSENHSKKGANIASQILDSKGFSKSDIEIISWLVEEHLFLIKAATRRDINDEETAVFCARKVKDIDKLKMLYLLTVADSMATGPKAWNEWTALLLRELFFKTLNIIEKGELATKKATEISERKREKLEKEELFPFLPPRYLINIPDNKIIQHINLYKTLGKYDIVWEIENDSNSNIRTITICAKDQPGLFSKISGAFTLNNINILNAQIYTWRNNIALDIFTVKPPLDTIFESEQWIKTKKSFQNIISGEIDLAKALKEKMAFYSSKLFTSKKPHKIIVDNYSSNFFTIIEVYAYDFHGLLYGITNALFQCKLDVWIAKIATEVDQIVDIFYVRDFDGQKVDSSDIVDKIKNSIEEVLKINKGVNL